LLFANQYTSIGNTDACSRKLHLPNYMNLCQGLLYTCCNSKWIKLIKGWLYYTHHVWFNGIVIVYYHLYPTRKSINCDCFHYKKTCERILFVLQTQQVTRIGNTVWWFPQRVNVRRCTKRIRTKGCVGMCCDRTLSALICFTKCSHLWPK